eukprot:gene21505-8242_t
MASLLLPLRGIHHGKWMYDGEGGRLKRLMRSAVRTSKGSIKIHSAMEAFNFLKKQQGIRRHAAHTELLIGERYFDYKKSFSMPNDTIAKCKGYVPGRVHGDS